jgi:hypothetical protein
LTPLELATCRTARRPHIDDSQLARRHSWRLGDRQRRRLGGWLRCRLSGLLGAMCHTPDRLRRPFVDGLSARREGNPTQSTLASESQLHAFLAGRSFFPHTRDRSYNRILRAQIRPTSTPNLAQTPNASRSTPTAAYDAWGLPPRRDGQVFDPIRLAALRVQHERRLALRDLRPVLTISASLGRPGRAMLDRAVPVPEDGCGTRPALLRTTAHRGRERPLQPVVRDCSQRTFGLRSDVGGISNGLGNYRPPHNPLCRPDGMRCTPNAAWNQESRQEPHTSTLASGPVTVTGISDVGRRLPCS